MLHEQTTHAIIEAAIRVHSAPGPGLLESAYSACLHRELAELGLQAERQLRLPVLYRGARVDAGYRIDFLVENCVIVELKAVEKLLPVHLRHGIRRVVNSRTRQDLSPASSVSSVVEAAGGSIRENDH